VKILFLSPFRKNQQEIRSGIVWGLEANGHEVSRFCPYLYNKNELKDLFFQKIKTFQPHIIFSYNVKILPSECFENLKEFKPKPEIIFCYGDYRAQIEPWLQNISPFIHTLLISNSEQIEYFKKFGFNKVLEFHIGVDPILFPKEKREDIDIIFGGNNYGNFFPLSRERSKFILDVKRKYNLEIYGRGWGKGSQPFIQNEPAYVNVLAKAKISLGFNQFDAQNYYTRRLWFSLLSGTCHLTRYIPNMERDFKNWKHLVWFQSNDEAFQNIEYLLLRKGERQEIGKAGQELVLSHHTWKHRFEQLFEELNEK